MWMGAGFLPGRETLTDLLSPFLCPVTSGFDHLEEGQALVPGPLFAGASFSGPVASPLTCQILDLAGCPFQDVLSGSLLCRVDIILYLVGSALRVCHSASIAGMKILKRII